VRSSFASCALTRPEAQIRHVGGALPHRDRRPDRPGSGSRLHRPKLARARRLVPAQACWEPPPEIQTKIENKKCKSLLKNQCEEKFALKWSESLLPILDRFINAYDGEIDCLFWNSMIKQGGSFGSGGSTWYSGWINIFFPFQSNGDKNKYCIPYDDNNKYVKIGLNNANKVIGLDVNNVPVGLASAPVLWKYYGEDIPLKFVAGFMGAKQDETSLAIEPNVGWFIAYPKEEK